MNNIQEFVDTLLISASAGDTQVSDERIEECVEHFRETMKSHFQRQPREEKENSLYMSQIGKPVCQQWFDVHGEPKEGAFSSPDMRMKMLFGDTVEVLVLFILKAAGLDVRAHQEPTEFLAKNGTRISGRYDADIDGGIWDVKTASPYSFDNKFKKGYDTMKDDDPFGYIVQGFAYEKGTGTPFKGWIAINKSTGEWAVVEVPEHRSDDEYLQAMNIIEVNSEIIASSERPKRCYDLQKEVYYKKSTGNTHLHRICGYCPHKFECWDENDIEFTVMPNSAKYKNPPKKWYVTR